MINRNSGVPMYAQLADIIRTQIADGTIQPGDKLMSESEMTREYGVARLTVREALSVLVSEGLLEKKHGKGTFCKNTSKGASIDVLLDMTDYYFIPYYVHSISKVLDKNGAEFIVGDTKNSWEEIERLLVKIVQKGSDGVIVQSSPEKHFDKKRIEQAFLQLSEKNIPVIQIDTDYQIIGQSYVIMDEEKIGTLAAQHFLENGHKKTAVIRLDNNRVSDMRMKNFRKMFDAVYEIEYNSDLTKNIRHAHENGVTGIFCFSDYVAKACIDSINSIGFSVPDDFSLISVDDTLIAKLYNLTSVTHAKERIGEFAARAITEHRMPAEKIFVPRLAVRGSVKNLK